MRNNPGKYTHRLTFQVKTEARSFGDITESWADWFTCWGAFEPIGSREFPSSQKRHTETTARFRIPFIQGRTITPDQHRVVFELDPTASPSVESTWDITAPLPVEHLRMEMVIEAKETK